MSGGSGGAAGETRSNPPPGMSGAGGSAGQSGGSGGSAAYDPLGGVDGGSAGDPGVFDALAGTAEDRNDVAGGAVCERVATIQCAGEASCCEQPGRSFDACKQTMKQGCITTLRLDAITSESVAGYERSFAATLFAEYERLTRQCDVAVVAWGQSIEGFRVLSRGTVSPGVTCKPAARDIVEQSDLAVAHLFACASPETHACLPTFGEWLCVPHATEGGACFMDMNCTDDLFCTNSKERLPGGGTCNARKQDGAPCDYATECLSLACKGGACVPASQQSIFCLQ